MYLNVNPSSILAMNDMKATVEITMDITVRAERERETYRGESASLSAIKRRSQAGRGTLDIITTA